MKYWLFTIVILCALAAIRIHLMFQHDSLDAEMLGLSGKLLEAENFDSAEYVELILSNREHDVKRYSSLAKHEGEDAAFVAVSDICSALLFRRDDGRLVTSLGVPIIIELKQAVFYRDDGRFVNSKGDRVSDRC